MLKKVNNLYKKYKNLSRKKKIVVIGIVLIVGMVGFSQWRKATKPSEYSTEAAKVDSIVELVSETGNVTTAGAVPIYSTTTGMVEEVYVNNGDVVANGDVLFKVKSTATKLEQDTALANYMAAKSVLETAKSTQLSLQATMFGQWDEFKELAESDDYEEDDGKPKYNERGVAEFHIPEKEWLAAEASYKNQQQIIAQASIQTSASWRAYQATQDSAVEANLGGEVRNLGVDKGDLIAVPTTLTLANTSPALILLNSDVRTTIKIQVVETDVLKVSEGLSVSVEFDAKDGEIFPATVSRVDTVAAPTEGVVSYAVYVVLNENTESIMGGMTADVDIVVATKENVLTVPSSAVKPYQGGRAVRTLNNEGEIEYIPVKTGSRGEGKIEILSGIEEGTQVIVTLANDQIERSGGLF